MKKQLSENKELMSGINKMSHYTVEQFSNDASRYVKAIAEGRVICSIGSVSNSGMSRTIKFLAPEKSKYDKKTRFYYSNFFAMFKALGFSPVKDSDYFRINGCGMDMIFHTNYSIMHRFERLGIITKKQCEGLAQQTPSVI